MKKTVFFLRFMCLTLILPFSCGTESNVMSPSALDGEWTIAEVNGKTVQEDSLGNTPFIGFDYAARRIYGNAGCNRMMGSFEADSLKPGTLSIGPVATTRMACVDMTLELSILETLPEVASFAPAGESGPARGNKVALYDAEGKQIMVLQKSIKEEQTEKESVEVALSGETEAVGNGSPEEDRHRHVRYSEGIEALDGEWLICTVNGKPVGKSEKVPFIGFDTRENKIYGNGGCNTFQGNYSQQEGNPRSLVPGSIATTMMMCGDMETEQMILRALNEMKSFYVLSGSRAVLYDAQGTQIMELGKKGASSTETVSGTEDTVQRKLGLVRITQVPEAED